MDLEASSSTLSTTCDTTTATQYHITKEQLWSEIKLITVWGLKSLTQLFLAGKNLQFFLASFRANWMEVISHKLLPIEDELETKRFKIFLNWNRLGQSQVHDLFVKTHFTRTGAIQ